MPVVRMQGEKAQAGHFASFPVLAPVVAAGHLNVVLERVVEVGVEIDVAGHQTDSHWEAVDVAAGSETDAGDLQGQVSGVSCQWTVIDSKASSVSGQM